jgi:hypothetical protein
LVLIFISTYKGRKKAAVAAAVGRKKAGAASIDKKKP